MSNETEDKIERQIAIDQLQQALGRVVAIGLNDASQKHGNAGEVAAHAINSGQVRLDVVMSWPDPEVVAFMTNDDGESHPLFKVEKPPEYDA